MFHTPSIDDGKIIPTMFLFFRVHTPCVWINSATSSTSRRASRIESPRRPRPHFPTRTNLPPTTPHARARRTHGRTRPHDDIHRFRSRRSITSRVRARRRDSLSTTTTTGREGAARGNQGHARRRRDDAREEPRGLATNREGAGGAGKYRRVDTKRTMD